LYHRVFPKTTYLPVLVEEIKPWTADAFWETLLQKLLNSQIGKKLKLPGWEPALTSYEKFRVILSSLREHALQTHSPEIRPILLIDEFSSIETEEWPLEDAQTVVSQIMQIVEEENVAVVLSVHTPASAFLSEPRTSRLRFRAREYRLGTLSPKGVQQLITMPLKESIEFSKTAVERLCHLSGGYPYYLNLLLAKIFQRFRSFPRDRREKMEENDVAQAVDTMLTDSGAFAHLCHSARQVQEGVIEAVVWASIDGEQPAALPAIVRTVTQSKMNLNELQLRYALEVMVDRGILTRCDDKGVPHYVFVVPLFGKWLRQRYPPL
jgi:hypothetical protein